MLKPFRVNVSLPDHDAMILRTLAREKYYCLPGQLANRFLRERLKTEFLFDKTESGDLFETVAEYQPGETMISSQRIRNKKGGL